MELHSNNSQNANLTTFLTGTLGALSHTVHRVRERVGTGRKKYQPNIEPGISPAGIKDLRMDTYDTSFKPLMSNITDIDTFLADWVNGSMGLPTSARTYSRLSAFSDFHSMSPSQMPADSWTRLQTPDKDVSPKVRNTSAIGATFVIDSDWLEEWIMRSPERSAERQQAYAGLVQPCIS